MKHWEEAALADGKDVEEVTRCKDCKFWNRHDGTFPDFDGKEWHECKQLYPFTSASGDSAITPSWFYCGYAMRKEE